MTREEIVNSEYVEVCEDSIILPAETFKSLISYFKDLEAKNNDLKEENQKQKAMLDFLKQYFIVEELSGKYWLRVGGGNYQEWFVYEITKDKYKALKEWKENE